MIRCGLFRTPPHPFAKLHVAVLSRSCATNFAHMWAVTLCARERYAQHKLLLRELRILAERFITKETCFLCNKKSRSTPAPRIHTQFHAHSIIVVVFRFLLLYFLRPYTCTCCNNTSSSLTFPPCFISYCFCRCSMFLNYTPYFPYVNRIFNFFQW